MSVRSGGKWNIVLSRKSETSSDRVPVLHRLRSTVRRRRQERMSSISQLEHHASIRCPFRIRISPQDLVVNHTLGWTLVNDLEKYRIPVILRAQSTYNIFRIKEA